MRGTLIAFSQIALLVLGSSPLSAAGSRSLLHRELNLAVLYSRRDANLDFHPAPLFSSVGLEYLQKFADGTPGRLNPDATDLYVQFAYDPLDDRLETRFRDVWIRFVEPESGFRVRLGHFDIPFGLNPIAEPRGVALQPLAFFDLGFKKDWGLSVQGEWQNFGYETAATTGMGDKLRRRRGRYLWTGRIGIPTYRDVQYGISSLYGVLPASFLSGELKRSWRLSMDVTYLYHEPYTVARGELTFGADDGASVGGFLLRLNQIIPADPRWALEAQMRAWRIDQPTAVVTRTEGVVGIRRALPYLLNLRLHWRHYFSSTGIREDDRIFAQLYYYGY